MSVDLRVATRTVLTRFPWADDIKARAYYAGLRAIRRPFEVEFRALRPYLESGMLCLDVGANHGQSLDALRMMNPGVRAVAFEPQPSLYRRLARRFPAGGQITVVPHGAGAEPGRQVLWVPSYNGYCFDGLATTMGRDAAVEWLTYSIHNFDESKVSVQEYEIEIVRLDDNVTGPVGLIKVDVQGGELHALRGAQRILTDDRPVVMVEQSTHSELDDLMASHGYAPHSYTPDGLVPGLGRLNTIYLPREQRVR